MVSRDKEAPRLTESGFQFLVWITWTIDLLKSSSICLTRDSCGICKLQLMETNAQLWYIIREYISNAEVCVFHFYCHILLLSSEEKLYIYSISVINYLFEFEWWTTVTHSEKQLMLILRQFSLDSLECVILSFIFF